MHEQNHHGEQLRVVFICGADLSAPSEKQALWFGQELVKRGHGAMLSLRGDPRTATGEGLDERGGPELLWHSFAGRGPSRASVEAVRAFEPTHFHAWSARLPAVSLARSYQAATDRPVFFHWEDNEWHLMSNVAGKGSRRAKHALKRMGSRVHPPLWHFGTPSSIQWAIDHGVAFDALTPALAAEVEERTGTRCAVLLPASPENTWGSPQEPTNDFGLRGGDGASILFTGDIHFARADDIRFGLTAIGRVQRTGRSVIFAHAGRNTVGIDLDDLAVDCGMRPGTTRSLGVLPFEQIPGLLREADILLEPGLPSAFNRLRLPSKLQAYLASGTPVITFGVGFGELLEDGQDVLKTHGSDPDELASAISRVLGDPSLKSTLSGEAPRTARRLFDPLRNTDALVEHYRTHLALGTDDQAS